MFGIERFENGQWKRVYTHEGAPVVYDGWAVKYAADFAVTLDELTGLDHRLCAIGASQTYEERCVAAYVSEGLGE